MILGHCAFHIIAQSNVRMVEAILYFLVKPSRVEPWTVNDSGLMKLYISWGVDGIITDRPDLMLELLGKRN
jgi:glycerophosphoryl diester phosphodiesterase